MSATHDYRTRLRLPPLEVLVETPQRDGIDLPEELAAIYGGPLAVQPRSLYANFVASLDGVTAIPGLTQSSHPIAASSEHDRFLMGLLRALADAILIGAATLHGSPQTRWTPEHAYPPAAALYAELRRRRGRPPQPTLAVLSGSGRIDPQHPGLRERALVLTTEQGAAQIGNRLPDSAAIVPLAGRPPIDPLVTLEALNAGGHELILCEGGPSLFGAFAAAGLVDELFLTLSPALAGRDGREAAVAAPKRLAPVPALRAPVRRRRTRCPLNLDRSSGWPHSAGGGTQSLPTIERSGSPGLAETER